MFKILFLSALMFFIGYWFFSFLYRLSGKGNRKQHGNEQYNQNNNATTEKSEKRFSKDVGEYVDFEEVEDDEK